MEHYPVVLQRARQEAPIAAAFVFDEDADDCTLTLQYEGREVSATADDYFEAMCEIRRQLAADGTTPMCYGASENVYPSGMAREMGQGLKAYRLTLVQPTKTADLVSIFASGPDVRPATVERQAAYFQAWLKSLGLQAP
jgi:hypothetical protein